MAANLTVNQYFHCNLIKRGGRHYANITSVRTKVNLGNFSFKFESETVFPFITKTMNQIVNANWRTFLVEYKAHIEKVTGDVCLAIFTSIFDKIAIEDFFHAKSNKVKHY